MAINNKLSSYSSLMNYLKGKGATDDDINKIENIDANYLDNFKNLSDDDKILGKSLLQNYLADAQATNTYAQQQNLINNQARQDTAYNEYVNSKLAKYLGEIESANGQTGYVGLTQGNRIALANNQMNAQQDISNNKTSALQQALSDYENQLIANSQYADDMYLTNKSAIDAKSDVNYQNALGELSSYLSQEGIKQTDSNGNSYISDDNKEKIANLIKANYGIDINTDSKIKSYIDAYLGWVNNSEEDVQSVTSGITLTANNGKSINETTNNASRVYNFSMDGHTYSLKAVSDENEGSLLKKLNSEIKAFSDYESRDAEKEKAQVAVNRAKNLKQGEMIAFGNDTQKFIIYFTGKQYVVFVKRDSVNSNANNSEGFDKLFDQAQKI